LPVPTRVFLRRVRANANMRGHVRAPLKSVPIKLDDNLRSISYFQRPFTIAVRGSDLALVAVDPGRRWWDRTV
jgi:hypothetical protein